MVIQALGKLSQTGRLKEILRRDAFAPVSTFLEADSPQLLVDATQTLRNMDRERSFRICCHGSPLRFSARLTDWRVQMLNPATTINPVARGERSLRIMGPDDEPGGAILYDAMMRPMVTTGIKELRDSRGRSQGFY